MQNGWLPIILYISRLKYHIFAIFKYCKNAKQIVVTCHLRLPTIKSFFPYSDVFRESDLFRRQHPPLPQPRPWPQFLFAHPAQKLGVNQPGSTVSSGVSRKELI
jgi:hypothetical protein